MKTVLCALIILLLLASSGCSDKLTSPNIPNADGGIKGFVKDTHGNLISDAKVFVIFDYGQPQTNTGSNLSKPVGTDSVVLDGPYAEVINHYVKLHWYTYFDVLDQGGNDRLLESVLDEFVRLVGID